MGIADSTVRYAYQYRKRRAYVGKTFSPLYTTAFRKRLAFLAVWFATGNRIL
jgi:hypothetical protein